MIWAAFKKGVAWGTGVGVGTWAGLLFLSNLDKLIPQKGRTR